MGKFVNLIRKKLGLDPKRDVTLTGKLPTEVTVNRNLKETAGYPVDAIPTPDARDDKGKSSSTNKLPAPDPKGNIGLDSNLPVNVQTLRRRSLKRINAIANEDVDLESGGTIDAVKQTAFGGTNPAIPTAKSKDSTETTELPDDGGLKRGSRVKVTKQGYDGLGNIDHYDRTSGNYLVSMDGSGGNLIVHKNDIKSVKPTKAISEEEEIKRDIYVDGHYLTSVHAKSKEDAKRKFKAAYPEHTGKKTEIVAATEGYDHKKSSILEYCKNRISEYE